MPDAFVLATQCNVVNSGVLFCVLCKLVWCVVELKFSLVKIEAVLWHLKWLKLSYSMLVSAYWSLISVASQCRLTVHWENWCWWSRQVLMVVFLWYGIVLVINTNHLSCVVCKSWTWFLNRDTQLELEWQIQSTVMSLSIIQLIKLEVLSWALIRCTVKIMLNRSRMLDSNLEPYSSFRLQPSRWCLLSLLCWDFASSSSFCDSTHTLSLTFSECFLFA